MSDGRQQHARRMPSWLVGLLTLAVVVFASVVAFSSLLGLNLGMPWSDTYEVKAVFSSAQNMPVRAPVRIAGVQVGEVTSVEPLSSAAAEEYRAQTGDSASASADEVPGEQAALVTMELTDEARPIRSDAFFKIRPRLFLEGNYFVDLQPGSPNAEEVDSGHTFPVNQTDYSVQLDQVLTTLQGDVRRDLQVFLNQFGNALIKHGGAAGFRELYRTSPDANKFTSQVNEAFLGTQPGDLSGTIRGLDRVVRALGRNEQALQDLVTNFRIFSGSFAAEDVALGQAIEELPGVLDAAQPAFRNLNASFPALRAFAREALPGVRSTPATLDAATPFIEQVRLLVSERELRGLVADLRPTIPELAELAQRSRGFMRETRKLSSCFNEVVIPWSNDTVEPVDPANIYPHDPVGRVFEETAYGLEGIASESRSGDANGQYIRVQAGGAFNTVKIPAAPGGQDGFNVQEQVGFLAQPLLGAMPRINESRKPNFRPDVPCETQEPPNLQATPVDIDDTPFDQNPVSAPASLDSIELPESVTARDVNRAGQAMGFPKESLEPLAEMAQGGEG